MSKTSSESLFRRAAIEALHEKPLGRPVCRLPRAWRWITGLLLAAVAILATLAPRLEWHRTESVRGWLVPAAGVVRVTSAESGVVTDVSVATGHRVHAGQVLATISTDVRGANGESRRKRDRTEIRLALAESLAREKLLGERFATRQDRSTLRLGLLEAEHESLARQIAYESERQKISEQRVRKLRQAGDAIPAWDLLEFEEELAARRSAVESLRQKRARIEGELESVRAEIAASSIETELARSELRANRVALRREMEHGETEMTLVAPVDGVVADITLTAGGPVRPGDALISLVPRGAVLHAELLVPSRSAAHIRTGQEVRLFVDAWPREKFGALAGKVEEIAGFVSGTTGGSAGGAYRVIVSIADSDRLLRPGMSLGAELLLERRDLIDWVAGPIRARFGS